MIEREREMEGQADRKEKKNREEGTKRGRAWKRDGARDATECIPLKAKEGSATDLSAG